MHVAEFCEGIADGVVDGPLAHLAPFDVGQRNPQSQSDGGGGQHLVAVGREEDEVGPVGTQIISQAERGQPDALGHPDVGVGTEQGLDPGVDRESVPLKFPCCMTEFGRQMRPHHHDLEGDGGVGGELP